MRLLERQTRHELMVEVEERRIVRLLHRYLVDASHHPGTTNAVENILFDGLILEENFLDDSPCDAGILNDFHVTLAVEEQRVVPLAHKEIVHLPLLALHHGLSAMRDDLQRKDDTLALQLAVSGKVKDKIVKQFVGSLRNDDIGEIAVEGVGSQRIDTQRVRKCAIIATEATSRLTC